MRDRHPLAGQTVVLRCQPDPDELDGKEFVVEDWWENVSGQSWMVSRSPAAMKYDIRSAYAGLPTDDYVVYGKVAGIGHLVHISELGGWFGGLGRTVREGLQAGDKESGGGRATGR